MWICASLIILIWTFVQFMCTFARIFFDRLDVDICLLYVHICRRKYPKELPQANFVCALIPP